LLETVLKNNGLQSYLSLISTDGCPGHEHWFSRVEVYLVANLLRLAAKSRDMSESRKLEMHSAAMNIVPCVKIDDKCLLTDLFCNWVFFDNYAR